jgi:hypothetical protein
MGERMRGDLGTGDLGGSRASRRQQQKQQQRRRRTVIATAVGGVLAVVAIVAVVLVVTRSDDSEPTPTAQERRTTTTSSTTTTTTLPVSTTAVPASDNPVVALAQQYDGRYTGTFTNTTFGTTGPANLELRIDPATGSIAVDADFDGDLFGGGAKEVRRISADVPLGSDANATITTETEKFGPVSGRIDETLALVLTAEAVPGDAVGSFTLTGRLRPDNTGFDATYTVTFEDGTTADGTVTVTCDPAGIRGSEVTTVCALTAPAPG